MLEAYASTGEESLDRFVRSGWVEDRRAAEPVLKHRGAGGLRLVGQGSPLLFEGGKGQGSETCQGKRKSLSGIVEDRSAIPSHLDVDALGES